MNAGLALSLFEETPLDEMVVRQIDHSTARQTVMKYHYSRRMPSGNLRCYGVWEEGTSYIGVVIFGDGATPELGSPYGLEQPQVAELARVAFTDHEVPVTQAVAACIRYLKQSEPSLRLIISFADERQGHLGVIYQAGNWIYAGLTQDDYVMINGEEVHPRTVLHRYESRSISWLQENVDPDAAPAVMPPKHRYLYPLDKAMRRQVSKLALPYPRGLSVDGDISGFQPEDASSTLADRSYG